MITLQKLINDSSFKRNELFYPEFKKLLHNTSKIENSLNDIRSILKRYVSRHNILKLHISDIKISKNIYLSISIINPDKERIHETYNIVNENNRYFSLRGAYKKILITLNTTSIQIYRYSLYIDFRSITGLFSSEDSSEIYNYRFAISKELSQENIKINTTCPHPLDLIFMKILNRYYMSEIIRILNKIPMVFSKFKLISEGG